MIVAIQSNLPGKLIVHLLTSDGRVLSRAQKLIKPGGAEQLLLLIDRTLRKKHKSLVAVKGILVITGPGPFTPVRVGLTVANTLAVAGKIPIYGWRSEVEISAEQLARLIAKVKRAKLTTLARPDYGRSPNISQPKRRPNVFQRRVDRIRGRTVAK